MRSYFIKQFMMNKTTFHTCPRRRAGRPQTSSPLRPSPRGRSRRRLRQLRLIVKRR